MVGVLETSARLLRLLSLLQARQDWSGAELAGRLDVDVRTIRRDMDRLRNLGYPVHAVPGVSGGYRLGAGAALPPLLLDDDEAVAVAIGLRTAAVGGVSGIEETSVRALAKLEHVLPSRLRHRVTALQAAVVSMTGPGPTVDASALALVAGACRDHERLRFEYRSHDKTVSRRLVEPHSLVHSGRRWYLFAWDVDRDDWRTFRMDRVDPRPPPGPRFTPRTPPDDVATYVSKGVTSGVYRYKCRILLHAPIEEVAERVTTTTGMLEPIDEHTCMLHAGGDNLNGMAFYIGLLGFDFEVLDPPELVEHLRKFVERMARAVRSAEDGVTGDA